MKEISVIEKGQCIPELIGNDGVFLTLDDCGFTLIVRFSSPTREEKKSFKAGSHVRIGIGVLSDIMYWCLKMGDIPMMDCTYSPNIEPYVPHLEIPQKGQGYSLTVLLLEATTGEVLNIRLLTLPYKSSIRAREIINDVASKKIDYESSIRSVYSYTTEELYSMADTKEKIV